MVSTFRLLAALVPIGLSALFATVSGSGPQAVFAATQVPFKAAYSGTINPPHGPPPVQVTGTGQATYLGSSTNNGTITVTGTASACPSTGFAVENDEVFTSTDDGDQITITIHDQSCPIAPGVFHGSGTYVVTGGTGRFTGATGQGTFDGHGDFNQGTFSLALNGTISAPNQN